MANILDGYILLAEVYAVKGALAVASDVGCGTWGRRSEQAAREGYTGRRSVYSGSVSYIIS